MNNMIHGFVNSSKNSDIYLEEGAAEMNNEWLSLSRPHLIVWFLHHYLVFNLTTYRMRDYYVKR